MDMEAIENQLEETKTIQANGFMNLEHYREFKSHAVAGLLKFGDCFSQRLGMALAKAEMRDALKILRYWNADCIKHALMNKIYIAKLKGEENERNTGTINK